MNVEKWINEVKNGRQLRVTYNEKAYDGCEDEGWWSEELYCYDGGLGVFRCYYPVSSYEKDFYTVHNDKDLEFVIRKAVYDYEYLVKDMRLEDGDIVINTNSLREEVNQIVDGMTDDQLRSLLLLIG